MARMKTFLKYLIVLLVMYVVFDFVAYRYLVNSYKNIKTYEISQESPKVTIQEAKATAINGYVKGKITNNKGKDIEKTNVKIDLYNKRNNNVGTRYEKIENFKAGQTIEFNLNFKGSNVSHFVISFTDENVDAEIEKQAKELAQTVNKWYPLIGLATLICMT